MGCDDRVSKLVKKKVVFRGRDLCVVGSLLLPVSEAISQGLRFSQCRYPATLSRSYVVVVQSPAVVIEAFLLGIVLALVALLGQTMACLGTLERNHVLLRASSQRLHLGLQIVRIMARRSETLIVPSR